MLQLRGLRRLLEVSVKRDHIFHQAVQELLVLFHPKGVQREVQGIRRPPFGLRKVFPGKQLDLIEPALALMCHLGCRLKLRVYLCGDMIQLDEGHVTHVVCVGLVLGKRPLGFEMPRVPVGVSDRSQVFFDHFEALICFPCAGGQAFLDRFCDALFPRMLPR
jgi:hypothetical protein